MDVDPVLLGTFGSLEELIEENEKEDQRFGWKRLTATKIEYLANRYKLRILELPTDHEQGLGGLRKEQFELEEYHKKLLDHLDETSRLLSAVTEKISK